MGVCTLLQITCIDINRDTCTYKKHACMYVHALLQGVTHVCMNVMYGVNNVYICMHINSDNLKQNKFAVIQQPGDGALLYIRAGGLGGLNLRLSLVLVIFSN